MVHVRRAATSDTERVLAMLKHIRDDDYVPRSWAKWVADESSGLVLVAEAGENIVGTCYVHFLPNKLCWFQAMRVDVDARRLGVGSALTAACIDFARTAGYRSAFLGIVADNAPSLNMSAKAGFKKICEYSRVGQKIAALKEGSSKEATRWRMAKEDDIDTVLAIGQSYAPSGAIFACWQWQPLSRAAIQSVIQEGDLWVWDNNGVSLWAGFNNFGEYSALFPMAGPKEELHSAFMDLLSWLPDEKETFLELWQTPDTPLLTVAKSLGFTGDDGYTIWEQRLSNPV
ncbi:MAG: hypothetical protein DDT35_01035 [Firmicutes bacterium]|nr:hypothetical protein [Bacillota bacterium]